MGQEQIRLAKTNLKCSCGFEFFILMDSLPRPGLYFCPECSSSFKITVEADDEL